MARPLNLWRELDPLGRALLVAVHLPLVARRRYPMTVSILVAVAAATYLTLSYYHSLTTFAIALAIYSLAAITTVAAGDMLFAPSVIRRLIEAYAYAPTTVSDDLGELTGREVEVLRLAARGLSNADIAAHLVLSEATVKTHLNRIMSKLGLSSRAQAVVVAYETGLVTPGQPKSV